MTDLQQLLLHLAIAHRQARRGALFGLHGLRQLPAVQGFVVRLFRREHDAAFHYFGGRPEECVYDQARLVVLHEQYRELDLNPAFAAYATAAGFRIHACQGYDPESKGNALAGKKLLRRHRDLPQALLDRGEEPK